MYTYDEFVKQANEAGVMDRFTPDELATAQKSPEFGISLAGLLRDQRQATTAEQRLLAAEAANQMRRSYGLQSNSPAAPKVAGAQDNYAGLLDQANAQGSFVYDPEKDPVWGSYKKQYTREGERASANAMAQAAAMSGGIPSSYAVTAGQQAGNYYVGQMSDIIPELEQNAYQRYLAEQELKRQEFNNAMDLYRTLGYATPEVAQILGIEADKTSESPDGPETHPEDSPANDNPDSAIIDPDTLTQMQQTYPSGVITSKSIWDALVAMYGENALRAAGYSYGSGDGGLKSGNGGGSKGADRIAFGSNVIS